MRLATAWPSGGYAVGRTEYTQHRRLRWRRLKLPAWRPSGRYVVRGLPSFTGMADRRYSSSRWQKLRKAVLIRDAHVCRVQGPRCTGIATTVHHIEPSSRRPDLFWADFNLVAACSRCNYGDGSRLAADNKRGRVEKLEQLVAWQDQRIQVLLEQLQQYEPHRPQPAPGDNRPRPAIR